MAKERLLRFAAPALYQSMADIFSAYHIHPHDVHAVIENNEDGIAVTIRFTADFSRSITINITSNQINQPDEQIMQFFQEAAEKCKSLLITGYYNMMKL